jgi:hypothetical protein
MASLSNSSVKQKSHYKEVLVPSRMMRLHAKAASKDFAELITIFRYHLKVERQRIASGENPPTSKESKALAKTILSIHKAWDKYNTRLYPPVSKQEYEQEHLVRKQAAAQVKQEESLLTEKYGSTEIVDSEALNQTPEISESIHVQDVNKSESSILNSEENEQGPIHPIQNNSKIEKIKSHPRKHRFLLPLFMQDPEWLATEQPWLKARYIVREGIDTQMAPSYNRWIVA